MGQSHVISGLVTKRSELAGQVEQAQQELDRLIEDLRTVEKAIRIYDPDYDLRTVRTKRPQKRNRFFKGHGEATRFVLETLRDANGPLTTHAIADIAGAAKGVKESDMNTLRASVLSALTRQRINGTVVEAGRDEGGSIKWRLAD